MSSTLKKTGKRSSPVWKPRRPKALCGVLLLAMVAGSAGVPEASAGSRQEDGTPGWVVGAAPHLDLWFHGLAVMGVDGPGPLPLYAAGYAAAIRQLKQERGVFPTALDVQAEAIEAEFASSPAFEVAHFLPLYFVSADRDRMFEALEQVARDGHADEVTDFRAKFGAGVVAQVLTESHQRQVLVDYSRLLEAEWNSFYENFWSELASSRQELHRELQLRWDHELAPRLQPYLHEARLNAGAIVTSPVLGAEGRIFEGDPRQRDDNLVVVGFPLGSADLDAVLANVVRELSFPILRRVLNTNTTAGRDPEEAEAESSLAAVRCGAFMLQRYAPDQVAAYQHSFVSALRLEPAAAGAALDAQFEQAFSISDELAEMLASEVSR